MSCCSKTFVKLPTIEHPERILSEKKTPKKVFCQNVALALPTEVLGPNFYLNKR